MAAVKSDGCSSHAAACVEMAARLCLWDRGRPCSGIAFPVPQGGAVRLHRSKPGFSPFVAL